MTSVLTADRGPALLFPGLGAAPRLRQGTGAYLRVSTEEQRERQSIATQREFTERHSALHEITIADWYADDGVTGTLPLEQRPEGARLLEDARSGKLDTVLIYRLDRLGRDPRLILNAVNELEGLGVQVKSMTEPFDTSNPSGRFLLTILSGVAGLERETIIERSVEGTNRLARQGAWLGGIVPYGYRVVGKSRDAALLVSDEPLAGLDLSEADVIRLIYRLAAEERWTCVKIAGQLKALGVPPAYTRDGRQVLRGKRKVSTSGIWTPQRVRNLLVSTTYKGLHQYGKRSKRRRDLIEREVPAIVTIETWDRAQQVLRSNVLFSSRNAKRHYLLRGLVKCGLCNLTYIGMYQAGPKRAPKTYYRCNGKHQGRGHFGLRGERCPSKDISGEIEDVVWQDVEGFLRNPGDVLGQLGERQDDRAGDAKRLRGDAARLEQALAAKMHERDLVIALFRRSRIDAAALDRQLDDIHREEAEISEQLESLAARVHSAEEQRSHLRSAEDLLLELNQRLDEPITWELKRQLIETLVERIQVDTHEQAGTKRQASATVTYRFDATATRTGRGSSPRPA